MGADASAPTISIEVSYAEADRQRTVPLEVPIGTTAREAAQRAGLTRYFPKLNAATAPLGVWGRRVDDAAALANGDRVEIYRPLRASAREQRRERARRG